MGDRGAINAAFGGRQSGTDGEAIMASYGGGGIATGAVTLATLALSGSLQSGVAASSVTITGATSGSTIAFNIGGLTASGSGTTRTVSGTPSASGSLIATETLAGAIGSPKATTIGTVAAATTTLNPLTILNSLAIGGSVWSSSISGITSGSTVTATSDDSTNPNLTISSGNISGTFPNTGSSRTVNITLHEVPTSGSPRDSVVALSIGVAGQSLEPMTRTRPLATKGSSTMGGTRSSAVTDFAGNPVDPLYIGIDWQTYLGQNTLPYGKDISPTISQPVGAGGFTTGPIIDGILDDINNTKILTAANDFFFQFGGNFGGDGSATGNAAINSYSDGQIHSELLARLFPALPMDRWLHVVQFATGEPLALAKRRLFRRQMKYAILQNNPKKGIFWGQDALVEWTGSPNAPRTQLSINEQKRNMAVSQLMEVEGGHLNGLGFTVTGAGVLHAWEAIMGGPPYVASAEYYGKNIAPGGLIANLYYFGSLANTTFSIVDTRFTVTVSGSNLQLKLVGAAPAEAYVGVRITINTTGFTPRYATVFVSVSARTGTAPAIVRIQNRAVLWRDPIPNPGDNNTPFTPPVFATSSRKLTAVFTIQFDPDDGNNAYNVNPSIEDTRKQYIWRAATASNDLIGLLRKADGTMQFTVMDATGSLTSSTNAISVNPTAQFRKAQGMRTFFVSYDADNPSGCYVYCSGASTAQNTYTGQLTAFTPTGTGTLDLARTQLADAAGGGTQDGMAFFASTLAVDLLYFEGRKGNIWIKSGSYIDFSDPANRALFFDETTQMAVDPGNDAGTILGITPEIYFPGDAAELMAGALGNAHDSAFGGSNGKGHGTSGDWSAARIGYIGTAADNSIPIKLAVSQPVGGRIGNAYSWTPTYIGGVGSKTFTVTYDSGSPTLGSVGLSLASGTGVISAATLTGSASTIAFNLTVTDSSGSDTQHYSIDIAAALTTQLFNATFTATDGTALLGKQADIGGTWAKMPGLASTTTGPTIYGGMALHTAAVTEAMVNQDTNFAAYTGDVKVTAVVNIGAAINSRIYYIVLCSQTDGTGYAVGINGSSTLRWNKISTAGALTSIGSINPGQLAAPTINVNTSYLLEIEKRGGRIEVYLDGNLIGISIDPTPITAAGYVGLYYGGATVDTWNGTQLNGVAFDKISAAPMPTKPTAATNFTFDDAAQDSLLVNYRDAGGHRLYRHSNYLAAVGHIINKVDGGTNGVVPRATASPELFVSDDDPASANHTVSTTWKLFSNLSQAFYTAMHVQDNISSMYRFGYSSSEIRLYKDITGNTTTKTLSVSFIPPADATDITFEMTYNNGILSFRVIYTTGGTVTTLVPFGPYDDSASPLANGRPGAFTTGVASTKTTGVSLSRLWRS